MTLQKFITYTPLDINGKQLDSNHELKTKYFRNIRELFATPKTF